MSQILFIASQTREQVQNFIFALLQIQSDFAFQFSLNYVTTKSNFTSLTFEKSKC